MKTKFCLFAAAAALAGCAHMETHGVIAHPEKEGWFNISGTFYYCKSNSDGKIPAPSCRRPRYFDTAADGSPKEQEPSFYQQ